ncbi:MAG TPA: zf-TFIIB domain-containing protein [Geobacteraceae bacterium]
MKCPSCVNVNLNLAERQGVEIDYCPECRGIWLDRGELDKIIERSYTEGGRQSRSAEVQAPRHEQRSYADYHHDDHDRHHDGQHRRKSWLSELLD